MDRSKNIEIVDLEVGARVRLRRRQIGVSQTALADRIGVTFQQVQKYEKGTNRISASRMQQIAVALDLPVASLFGSVSEVGGSHIGDLMSDAVVTSRDGIELNRAFVKIANPDVRKSVIELLEALARET